MQHQLLAKVVAALDSAGIAHMVTGSFASTFHGEPRMTRDIDLVIDPDTSNIALFTEQFDPSIFYIDDAVSATARRDMFNIIDVTTGWKVDLIIRKDRPFSAEEFRRRRPAVVSGVATPQPPKAMVRLGLESLIDTWVSNSEPTTPESSGKIST